MEQDSSGQELWGIRFCVFYTQGKGTDKVFMSLSGRGQQQGKSRGRGEKNVCCSQPATITSFEMVAMRDTFGRDFGDKFLLKRSRN